MDTAQRNLEHWMPFLLDVHHDTWWCKIVLLYKMSGRFTRTTAGFR